MAGAVPRERSTSPHPIAEPELLALVSASGEQPPVAAALERLDLELTFVEDAAQLAGATPSLIVLCVQGTLATALAADFGPLCRVAELAPIVIVCPGLRPGELRLALAAGAAGIVLEAEVESALAATVQAALAGQVCVPRRHAQRIEPAALSAREKQILGLVVMGYGNAQIAGQLFLAESTVKGHLSSAFVKLGVKSRNEAVELILDPERGVGFGILGLGSEPIELEPDRTR